MSHLSKIEVEINDLQALKQACNYLGLEFRENQDMFNCYNGKQECTHAIVVPGARFEVGVVQKGKSYELLWDNWTPGGLVQKLGENACELRKHYTLQRVKNEAFQKNFRVQEQNIERGTRLILTS